MIQVGASVPTTTDNCGVASITSNAPSCFPVGTTTVTWTATDIHGNVSTCNQTVTVTDTTAPTITCPASVTVYTDSGVCQACNVTLVPAPTVASPVTLDYADRFITYTGASINGGSNSAIVAPGSTVSLSYNMSVAFDYGTGYCPGCVVQSYIGLGNSGTTIACESSIYGGYTNTENVTFTAPSTPGIYYITQSGTLDYVCQPQNFNNAANNAIAVIQVGASVPTTTDNCGVASITSNAPSCFPVGTTTVTWTATDIHGNVSTCSQTVTVLDTTAPVISCHGDTLVTVTAGQCAVVNFVVHATDNCSGNVSIVSNPASGSIFPMGTTTVSSTVTDSSGNTSSCTFNITVTSLPDSVSASICNGTTYNFNGTILSQAGIYTDTLTASTGCDSIVVLTLSAGNAATASINASICAGSSYNFNGTLLTSAGTYIDTLNGSNTCDSIITLTLTVRPVATSSLTASICAGSSYNFNGTQLTAPGTYSDTLTGANTCDSIVTLTLTVRPVATSSVTASICAGSSYNFNGTQLTAAGTYADTLTGSNTCDSIVTLTLTVRPVATSSINAFICAGNSYNFNGTLLTTPGTYRDTLTGSNTCDSIVTLNLTVRPVATSSITASICAGSSYNFNGSQITSAGTYIDTLTGSNTCDSIVTLTLTIKSVANSSVSASICSGGSYNFNGTQLTAAGTYRDTLTGVNGCDSIVTLTLTVSPGVTVNLGNDTTVCQGTDVSLNAGNAASYLWSTGATTQTITVANTGTYTVTASNGGCSATDSVHVTVNYMPVVTLGTNIPTCDGNLVTLFAGNPGATYHWSTGSANESISFTTSGTYSVTVTNGVNCSASSSIVVTFSPAPSLPSDSVINLCNGATASLNAGNPGSTYLWSTGSTTQSINATISDIYAVTVTNASHCTAEGFFDVLTQSIIVSLIPNVNFCSGDYVILDAGYNGSTYQWSNGTTAQTLTTSTAGNYSVTVTTQSGCTAVGSSNLHKITPVPVTLNLNVNTICFNAGNETLSGGTPGGGVYSGVGVAGGVFSPSSAPIGPDAITYTVSDSGCSYSATDTIHVTYCTDVASLDNAMKVDLYPNPSNGNFELVIATSAASDFSIDVVDVDGRKIVDAMHQTAQTQYMQRFDLSALAKGIYFVRVMTSSDMVIKRIVLQ